MRMLRIPLVVLILAGCAGQAREPVALRQAAAVAPAGAVTAAVVSQSDDPAVAAAAAQITPERIHRQIAYLASDEMRGRDTPSPELERAAEYIAEEFRSFGLQPGGDPGSYIQRFPLQRRALDVEATRFRLRSGAGAEVTLTLGTDFAAFAGVPNEVRAPVVVVTGRIEPDMTGLAGRVVVARLPGPDMTRDYSRALAQQRNAAREAGAVGAIFVVDEEFPTRTISLIVNQSGRPSSRPSVGEARDIPTVLLTRAAARRVGSDLGVDLLGSLQASTGGVAQVSSRDGVEIEAELSAPVKVIEEHRVPNVIGILPGSDPELRDTYVVFSAHFDHVGVGRPDATGDSIYNGADDNASGTSGLLEVARAFASLPKAPARSLLFLAVSAEEKGLLGSEYFSEYPTVALEQIVANINVDMIGRNSPDSIVVIGQEYSSLGPLVQRVAAAHPELGLTVAEDIWPQERFFFRSDHYNFARKDIPALFFFAGVHEDYHRPSDHVEKIDLDKTARVSRLIFYTAYEIANDRQPPQWTEQGLREVRGLTARGR